MIHGPHSFKKHDGFGRFVIISVMILCQSHNAAISLITVKACSSVHITVSLKILRSDSQD